MLIKRILALFMFISTRGASELGPCYECVCMSCYRVASSKTRKLYHSDIRMIFARDKFEYDSRIANYEYRSLTEGPVKPKYSPKK